MIGGDDVNCKTSAPAGQASRGLLDEYDYTTMDLVLEWSSSRVGLTDMIAMFHSQQFGLSSIYSLSTERGDAGCRIECLAWGKTLGRLFF